jgi:hypothetical protein
MGYGFGELKYKKVLFTKKTRPPKPPLSLLFHPCSTFHFVTTFGAYANIHGITVRKKKATLEVLGMC